MAKGTTFSLGIVMLVDNALCEEIVKIVATGCQLLFNGIQTKKSFPFILLLDC